MWPSLSRKRLVLVLLVLAVLVFAPIIATSQLYFSSQGSTAHTNFGVSQLWAGYLGGERFPIRLFNPGPVAHIASILVYTAPQLGEPGNVADFESDQVGAPVEPRRFLGCLNIELPPHGAVSLEDDFFTADLEPNDGNVIINPFATPTTPRPAINPERLSMYVEIVSAAKNHTGPGAPFSGLSDGQGLAHSNGDDGTQLLALNPWLFSAGDSTVPGQQQQVTDCMCDEVVAWLDASNVPNSYFFWAGMDWVICQ